MIPKDPKTKGLFQATTMITPVCHKMLEDNSLDEAGGKGTASKGLSLGRSTRI